MVEVNYHLEDTEDSWKGWSPSRPVSSGEAGTTVVVFFKSLVIRLTVADIVISDCASIGEVCSATRLAMALAFIEAVYIIDNSVAGMSARASYRLYAGMEQANSLFQL